MLKISLYTIILAFSLAACADKIPGPCECDDQPQGEICREVIYNQGNYAGYIDYRYDKEGNIEKKEYYSNRKLVQTIRYTYTAAGKIAMETLVTPGHDKDKYWEYYYNKDDSLISQVLYEEGIAVSHIDYSYSALNMLSTKATYEKEMLLKLIEFSYYENGKTWTVIEKNNAGQITHQRHFIHYQNQVVVINHFDGNMQFSGYEMTQYLTPGKLLMSKQYDSYKNLQSYVLNEYHGDHLSRSAHYNGQGKMTQQTHYLYFD